MGTPPESSLAIDVCDLTRSYGDVQALDGLSLVVLAVDVELFRRGYGLVE